MSTRETRGKLIKKGKKEDEMKKNEKKVNECEDDLYTLIKARRAVVSLTSIASPVLVSSETRRSKRKGRRVVVKEEENEIRTTKGKVGNKKGDEEASNLQCRESGKNSLNERDDSEKRIPSPRKRETTRGTRLRGQSGNSGNLRNNSSSVLCNTDKKPPRLRSASAKPVSKRLRARNISLESSTLQDSSRPKKKVGHKKVIRSLNKDEGKNESVSLSRAQYTSRSRSHSAASLVHDSKAKRLIPLIKNKACNSKKSTKTDNLMTRRNPSRKKTSQTCTDASSEKGNSLQENISKKGSIKRTRNANTNNDRIEEASITRNSRLRSKAAGREAKDINPSKSPRDNITNSEEIIVNDTEGSSEETRANHNLHKKLDANEILNLLSDVSETEIEENAAALSGSSNKKVALRKRPEKPKEKKKLVYANAVEEWENDTFSTNVYDHIIVEEDEYLPSRKKVSKKKRVPRPRKPVKKFCSSVPKSFKSTPSHEHEQHDDIPIQVDFDTMDPPAETEKPQQSFSMPKVYIDSSMLHPSNPRAFSPKHTSSFIQSESRSYPSQIAYRTPPVSKNPLKSFAVKVSTPRETEELIKFPLTIRDQVKICFGFSDSEEEDRNLVGGISPIRTVKGAPKNTFVSPFCKAPSIDESSLLKPTRFELPTATKKQNPILKRINRLQVPPPPPPKTKESEENVSLLYDDLSSSQAENISKKKTSPGHQRALQQLNKKQTLIYDKKATDSDAVVKVVKTDIQNQFTISDSSLHVPNKCRKRTLDTYIEPSSPKRTKKQKEEIKQWENSQSSHFSEIDEFDLTFT